MGYYEKIADLVKDGHVELVDILLDRVKEQKLAIQIASGVNKEAHEQLIHDETKNPYQSVRDFLLMNAQEENMIDGDILEKMVDIRSWAQKNTGLDISFGESDQDNIQAILSMKGSLSKFVVSFQEGQDRTTIQVYLNENPLQMQWANRTVESKDTAKLINEMKSLMSSCTQVLENECDKMNED